MCLGLFVDSLLMVAPWGAASGLRSSAPRNYLLITRNPETSELLDGTAGLRNGTFGGSRFFFSVAIGNQGRHGKKVTNDTVWSWRVIRHNTLRHHEKRAACFRARLA